MNFSNNHGIAFCKAKQMPYAFRHSIHTTFSQSEKPCVSAIPNALYLIIIPPQRGIIGRVGGHIVISSEA
jgi:hypothetical protein